MSAPAGENGASSVIAGARTDLLRRRGACASTPARTIETDAVISLPRLEGRRIEGIPHDEDGFVAIDEHGSVVGLERVYAAGDVSSLFLQAGRLRFPASRHGGGSDRRRGWRGGRAAPLRGRSCGQCSGLAQGPRYLCGGNGGMTCEDLQPQPAASRTPAQRQAHRPLPVAPGRHAPRGQRFSARLSPPRPRRLSTSESGHDGAVSEPSSSATAPPAATASWPCSRASTRSSTRCASAPR